MNLLVSTFNVICLFLIAWWVSRDQLPALKRVYWPTLLFKITCGLAVGWVYFYFYEGVGDTILYFRDGNLLADKAIQDPPAYFRILFSSIAPEQLQLSLVAPRALFFSKIVSVFSLLTANNYWLISCYFSLFSFLASWYLVRCVHQHLSGLTWATIIGFLCMPSVVFWSSGIIKESVACAALFFLSGIFLSVWFVRKLKFSEGFFAVAAFWLLWSLKYHYAAIFVAVISAMFIFRWIRSRHFLIPVFKSLLIWVALIMVPLLLITLIHPNFQLSNLATVIVDNNHAFQKLSEKNDLIHFYDLTPDVGSIVINAPWACFSGIFRPFISEANNILQLTASLETLTLLVVTILGLWKLRLNDSNLLVFALGILTFVVVLSTFITLSTPNFGTLSRYRVGYQPYFVAMLLSVGTLGNYLERKSLVLFKQP